MLNFCFMFTHISLHLCRSGLEIFDGGSPRSQRVPLSASNGTAAHFLSRTNVLLLRYTAQVNATSSDELDKNGTSGVGFVLSYVTYSKSARPESALSRHVRSQLRHIQ
jgi:hypothetical protein